MEVLNELKVIAEKVIKELKNLEGRENALRVQTDIASGKLDAVKKDLGQMAQEKASLELALSAKKKEIEQELSKRHEALKAREDTLADALKNCVIKETEYNRLINEAEASRIKNDEAHAKYESALHEINEKREKLEAVLK